jgi:hypothetical protein
VGSEDSLFELLEYTRNANFVQIEQDNFVFDINYHSFDYENFSAQNELRSVLLMTDFNEDGTHECVVEKHDVTGDGEYNVFKYGYVDPAGEISYHTIISQARPSQTLIDKKESVSHTNWFGLKDTVGEARRSLHITTIINNTIDKDYYSVQSDFDLDGLMDEETSLEIIYNNIQVTTYTKEITVVKAMGTLEELRVSTFVDSSMSQTMVFTDMVSDEVVSTRVYEDAFPNELTEFNSVENYLILVVSETISSQTPDLNALFSFSHAEDDVPAEFDRVTTIENGEIITDNLLFTTQSISIPGVYSEDGQGLGSYSIEAIKSIPADGTRWINDFRLMSLAEKDRDGYYLYYDSSDDGIYETIFVMDENDNVVGIGFDYDQDSRFHPAKTVPVVKQVLWSENYQGISVENDYIHFKESDKEVGTFKEPIFSDVLFDVFLMDFKGDSSALIYVAETMATNQFEEEVTLLTMAEDIAQQVAAILLGVACSTIAAPIGLPHVGYMIGYLAANLVSQQLKIIEREQFIAHRTFVLDSSDGEKVLGSKFWFDDLYGNLMPLTVFGSVGGVYAPVFLETDRADPKASSATTSYTRPKLDYWLSTRNLAGYSDDEPLMTSFLSKIGVLNPVITNFGIGEFTHKESSIYYVENEIREETFENGDAVLDTIVPTIDYVGDAYSPRMTFADSQGGLPTPEFYTEYPVFVPEGSAELEEVSSIYKIVPIEDITPSSGVEIQLFDGDIGLKADIDSINAYILWSDLPDKMYYSAGRSPGYISTLYDGDFEFESDTGVLTITSQAKLTQMLTRVSTDTLQLQENNPEQNFDDWSYYVVFQVNVEKYRSVADLRDLTSEQVGKIATAQAIEAAIFEYNYQFNLATQTQACYHELIYTVVVTAISTAISMGATLYIGKVVQLAGSLASTATKELSKSASKMLMGLLQPTAGFTAKFVLRSVAKEIGQEVLIDPWIESTVSGWVRRAGGDATLQMVLSSVAESLREALTGPFANLFSSQQSGSVSLYEQLDAKYFSNGLKPTIQDLLNSFNDYKAEIKAQLDQQKKQRTALGRGFRALTFVVGAAGFGVAQFVGPPVSLLYATLATFCFTEGISLKNVFSKAFNPVMVTVSKVGDYYRDNKKEILFTLGIGVVAIGLKALQILLPPLAILGDFALGFGAPITIGIVNQRRQIDLSVSIRDLIRQPRKHAIILRKNQIMSAFLKKSVQTVTLDRDIVKVSLHTNIASMDFAAVKPLESRFTIFTKANQELMRIYRKKGTQFVDNRQVFGVIYGIIDWSVGEIVKVGRTERPLSKRRSEYYSNAKKLWKSNQKLATDPITQRILDLLNKGGEKLAKSTLQWIPIEITLRTGSSRQKWSFDKKLIETLEQWWQNKFGTKISGLDRTSGAAGPHSLVDPIGSGTADTLVPDVFINWRVLKALIGKGCTYPQMIDILATRYLLPVTRNDIIDNIEYHWPFLIDQARQKPAHTQPNSILKDAKYYFIAPIIKSHVENGITNTRQIQDLFKSTENPQGISLQTILRAVKKEYQTSSWAGFLRLCGASLSPQSLLSLTPQEYRDVGGKSKERYEKFLISQYIIQGRNEAFIDNQLPDLTYSAIQRRIIKWWGSYYEARKQLVGPILTLCLKKGWTSTQIRANVPFFQNSMPGSYSWDVVRHYSLLWFEITPSALKNFLVTHNLQWFLTNYL